MSTRTFNIVQAEFLHFTRGTSLAEVVSDVFERAAEGVRASTVIRLYDEQDRLAPLITRSSFFSDASHTLNRALVTFPNLEGKPKGSIKEILNIMHATETLERRAHKEAVACFISELERAIKTKSSIAVDRVDASFRMTQDNELYDLMVSAKRATVANLFLFPPNDLLAASHKSVIPSLA